MKKFLTVLSFMFLFSTPVYADVVWPAIYIIGGMYSVRVIVAGLFIEWLFVKFFTNTSWAKAGLITFLMNLITCILGVIIIIPSSFLIEFIMYPFSHETFHWSHWLMGYLDVIFINTLIEGFFIKLALKQKFKSTFWWLFIANTISVLICALFIALKP